MKYLLIGLMLITTLTQAQTTTPLPTEPPKAEKRECLDGVIYRRFKDKQGRWSWELVRKENGDTIACYSTPIR